jgi:hypothetical protein
VVQPTSTIGGKPARRGAVLWWNAGYVDTFQTP